MAESTTHHPTTPTKSNVEWNDDLLLDPHAGDLREGREDGRTASLQAGFDEGRALGQAKALEIGLELGFFKGCCESALSMLLGSSREDSTTALDVKEKRGSSIMHQKMAKFEKNAKKAFETPEEKKMRIVSNIHTILKLTEDFPTPDMIFDRSLLEHNGGTADCGSNPSDDELNKPDVMKNLEEIRAKVSNERAHGMHDLF